ncbi:MAG: phasin family protein [Pseudomonadota bacterium]
MATKKTNGATEVENMVAAGSEAWKEGFEKAAKSYDDMASFSRDNIEAVIKSANAFAKGVEAVNTEALAFSKQSMEDSIAAAKAAMSSRSVQEFMEINSDFTKSAFDTMVSQMTKMGDLFADATKEAVEPINGRVSAVVEMVQQPRA